MHTGGCCCLACEAHSPLRLAAEQVLFAVRVFEGFGTSVANRTRVPAINAELARRGISPPIRCTRRWSCYAAFARLLAPCCVSARRGLGLILLSRPWTCGVWAWTLTPLESWLPSLMGSYADPPRVDVRYRSSGGNVGIDDSKSRASSSALSLLVPVIAVLALSATMIVAFLIYKTRQVASRGRSVGCPLCVVPSTRRGVWGWFGVDEHGRMDVDGDGWMDVNDY